MKDSAWQGSTGVVRIHTFFELSSFKDITLKVLKPDGSTAEWEGACACEHEIFYKLKPGDLDQPGAYVVQASVTWPDGRIKKCPWTQLICKEGIDV